MYRREVSLFIFYNGKNEILLQNRRSASKAGEEWGFFGGGIEEGESPEQALVHEVDEEMDLDLTDNFKQIGIIENTYFNKQQNRDANIKRYVFVSKYNNEKYVIKEGRGAKWFDLDAAENLKLVPGDDEVVKLVSKHLDYKPNRHK